MQLWINTLTDSIDFRFASGSAYASTDVCTKCCDPASFVASSFVASSFVASTSFVTSADLRASLLYRSRNHLYG